MHLFVSYAHEGGYGNLMLERVNPPRNYEEVEILQNALSEKTNNKCVLINWIVVKS